MSNLPSSEASGRGVRDGHGMIEVEIRPGPMKCYLIVLTLDIISCYCTIEISHLINRDTIDHQLRLIISYNWSLTTTPSRPNHALHLWDINTNIETLVQVRRCCCNAGSSWTHRISLLILLITIDDYGSEELGTSEIMSSY